MKLLFLWGLAVVVTLAAGCGVKGDPVPYVESIQPEAKNTPAGGKTSQGK